VANRQEGKIFQSIRQGVFFETAAGSYFERKCPLVGFSISLSSADTDRRALRALDGSRLNRPAPRARQFVAILPRAIAHCVATARFKSTMGDGSTWINIVQSGNLHQSVAPAIGA